MKLDAIVVGGSYAGISAALQLARARRQVAVVDAGQRRNRFAATSHGFFGQDGRPPQPSSTMPERSCSRIPTCVGCPRPPALPSG